LGVNIKIYKMDWKTKNFSQIKGLRDEAIVLSSNDHVCIKKFANSPMVEVEPEIVFMLPMIFGQ
jgi:hypothetical protein